MAQSRDSYDLKPFIGRMFRALVKRAVEGDRDALHVLYELQTDLDAAICDAAKGLWTSGDSWTEIGYVLGISRQAARQRFSSADLCRLPVRPQRSEDAPGGEDLHY